MRMFKLILPILMIGSAWAQTVGTVYKVKLGTAVIGTYPTIAAAQVAATANGAGTYTLLPLTTTQGTPISYVVSATASPSGTTLIAPTTAVITDAAGNKWGLLSGQVTVNGTPDATTQKVIEMAYVTGTVWQESTNLGAPLWWGKTSPTAAWLPTAGTATSPLGVPACGAAPASSTATVACPTGYTGSWMQTTTYASAPAPTCWTPVLNPTTAPAGACTPVSSGGTSRPSYNTGNGFYVLNGQLYDANGNLFRIRGVDRCHYDSPSQPGMSHAGVNAVRMFMYGLSVGAPKYVSILQTQHIAYNEVPIPSVPLFPDGTTTSGNTSTTELAAGVAWWVANAATFTPLNKYLIINVANEWGPSNSATWASAYETAIGQLRAAGYLGPIMIDSGGWGQDTGDLLNYSTAVFNSDPQKNIIFSLHIYGSIPTASVAPTIAALGALSKSVGMVFVIGEFGPGRNIGPSPTLTTPDQIIAAAEANGIGWMPWAWDDNNLSGGASNNSSFSMTLAGPGIYNTAADLTTYGVDMVGQFQALAKPASIFSGAVTALSTAQKALPAGQAPAPGGKKLH